MKDPETNGTVSQIDSPFWCGFSAECKLAFWKPSVVGFDLISTIRKIISTFPILNAQAALLNILISFSFFLLLLPFFLNISTVIWKDFAYTLATFPVVNFIPVCLSTCSAAAVITPERSPRPTSAPAIAQAHAAEPVPVKPDVKDVAAAYKVEKEAAKPDVRREEIPAEKAKPEPADAAKVGHTSVSLEETALVLGWSIGSKSHPRAAALSIFPTLLVRGLSLTHQSGIEGQGSGSQGNPIPEGGGPGQLGFGGSRQNKCNLL